MKTVYITYEAFSVDSPTQHITEPFIIEDATATKEQICEVFLDMKEDAGIWVGKVLAMQ